MHSVLEETFSKVNTTIAKLKGRSFDKKSTETLIIELRNILLEADIPYTYIMSLLRDIQVKLMFYANKKTNKSTIIGGILQSRIEKVFSTLMSNGIKLKKYSTTTIGIYGPNGVGKTSFAAKLANFLQKKHNKISMCVSFDAANKASQQQLKTACKNNNIEYLNLADFNNLNKGLNKVNEIIKYKMVDILIIDNAGCSPNNIDCIASWQRIIDNVNFDEKIVVFDGMYGQNAPTLIKEYCDIVNPTGFAISKIDSNQKGGIFFSIAITSNKPIYYTLDGEKIYNIHEFNKKTISDTLYKTNFFKEAIKSFKTINKSHVKKITKQFNYNDLLKYLEHFMNSREVNKIYSILLKVKFKENKNVSTEDCSLIKKWISIINSMTPFERSNFERLNVSRINRIARGAGVSECAVMSLQKKIEEINKKIYQ